MSMKLENLPGKGNFARGLHPDDRKTLASGMPIEVLPTPASVTLAITQHIGAPCEATVKLKDTVTAGQVVGQANAFVSAPVHSPVNGVVSALSVATLPNGRHVKTVVIQPQGQQLEGEALYNDTFGGDWSVNVAAHEPHAIAAAVRDAGLVGMGGAAFPTHVKLTPNDAKPVDTLLVNGCECEPYLTADYRMMLEAPAAVVAGARLAARAAGAKRIIIAIEDNKPDAIEAMRKAAGDIGVIIAVVNTKYPMGGERQLVVAVLNREVPTGGLPLDVGVVVMNIGTAIATARAVLRHKPLTHRVITVSGNGITKPRNILAPIGVSYQALIDYCGGLNAQAARVVSGGPMMGFAMSDLSAPVTKGTSGITVMTASEVKRSEETACVRCGRCVDVCPLRLVPTKIAMAARHQDWDLARKYHITACCECGCCAYICPASIPLAQLIRTGKARMPRG